MVKDGDEAWWSPARTIMRLRVDEAEAGPQQPVAALHQILDAVGVWGGIEDGS